MSDSPTVLCAQPDAGERAETADALADAGLAVKEVGSVETLTEALDRSVDCVVTAFDFPDGDGFDVVDAVRSVNPACVVALYTEHAPSDLPRGSPEQVVEYVPRTVPESRERLADVAAMAAAEITQAAYPVPETETERLAAVQRYDVDQLAATDAFDRLTALMTSHFDIDVAFVGLMDEHEERFVACEGANWRTLAREDTICTHTILTDETMVVEDTHEDPRFAEVDALKQLDIRSYAGVRLTDREGNAIGAVCCTDSEPRRYTQAELDDLQRFADEVEEQLLLRRQLQGDA
ncbi:small GAF containing sensor [Haloarcula taiwanensis]|uniref:Small GAF containing sensor n=1 Tax=Haloarcula taiwanensis TaxID=1932004 RepID=A0A2H4ZVG8_9EURY|nr:MULTISPECIES: GAF domain-containing protein [Haloarcula]AUG46452.1 small GAF containing sensor [Haloarcula taiwanensis]RLM36648.1 GAF domain-containing protein [Haloarcula sp. Atlit-120R]RLM44965.1 GAF domain-containing protein [Haloarcula sp. Atlit-47R]